MSRFPMPFAEALRSRLISFAWDQWSQMGVSGSTERHDRWSIDPEALLVFTLCVARREPRLFDEVLDWMRLNLDLISAQRLRNFANDDPGKRLASAALSWASAHSTKVTRQTPTPARASKEPESLFIRATGTMRVREPDPIFVNYGFLRPRAEPSHKSSPPARRVPINLSFRLRDLFGVGSRAEVVRVLLLLPGAEPRTREIVRAAGYSRQNVHEALNALVSAGVVFMRQKGPRDRWYALDIDRWANLLDVPMHELPYFVEWPRLLGVLWELLSWAESVEARDLSEYMMGSEARQFVAGHEIDLRALGAKLPDERRFLGADYWAPFELMVVDALTQRLAPVPEGMAESI